MNNNPIKSLVLLSATLGLGASALAQQETFTVYTNYTVNAAIPDNNASGVASTRNFTSLLTGTSDLNLTLNVAGNFNGDLYAFLTHDSGFAIVLNRLGRRLTNDIGYGDFGINVKLDDAAPSGDIHVYRATLSGSDAQPLGGALTGLWAPDARNIDPALVVAGDPRTALFSTFNGLDPNGAWTLFITDTASGGSSTLVSWGLEVTGVPEPATWTLLALGGFGLLWASRRQKKA